MIINKNVPVCAGGRRWGGQGSGRGGAVRGAGETGGTAQGCCASHEGARQAVGCVEAATQSKGSLG